MPKMIIAHTDPLPTDVADPLTHPERPFQGAAEGAALAGEHIALLEATAGKWLPALRGPTFYDQLVQERRAAASGTR